LYATEDKSVATPRVKNTEEDIELGKGKQARQLNLKITYGQI